MFPVAFSQLENFDKGGADDEVVVELRPRFEDATLEELYWHVQAVKRNEKQLEKQYTVEDLLYLCVVMCFGDLGLHLTPDLHHYDFSRVGPRRVDTQDLMLKMHSADAIALVLEFIEQLTYETKPIAIGSYQMRMPPMVKSSSIAIPYVFMSQMYEKSIRFGYSLKRAQQVQELERSLSSSSAASKSYDDGLVPTTELAPLPISAYLYRVDASEPSALQLGSDAARHVCKLQTDGLFGSFETHSSQLQRLLQDSASVVSRPLPLSASCSRLC
jgi:hypothetical protein